MECYISALKKGCRCVECKFTFIQSRMNIKASVSLLDGSVGCDQEVATITSMG